jgi:hypothetical protein
MTIASEAVFDLLVRAACDGIRCPTNDDLGANRGAALNALTRSGAIRVEVYERNYRVVEILKGDHAGKRTAEHPGARKPYRVIDANGDQWVTRKAGDKKMRVRHVERRSDAGRDGPAPVTLPRLSFLEGNK